MSVERQKTRDEQRIRQLLEDVYVRDMYMKETHEALSREFADAFQILVPSSTAEPMNL